MNPPLRRGRQESRSSQGSAAADVAQAVYDVKFPATLASTSAWSAKMIDYGAYEFFDELFIKFSENFVLIEPKTRFLKVASWRLWRFDELVITKLVPTQVPEHWAAPDPPPALPRLPHPEQPEPAIRKGEVVGLVYPNFERSVLGCGKQILQFGP